MFRYDPSRKRIIHIRQRTGRGGLESRPGRVRRGMYKGARDNRHSRCFQRRCLSLKRTMCPWCRHLSYVPSMLQKQYNPYARQSTLANKLGCLMAQLQNAQNDLLQEVSSTDTIVVGPTMVTCSTYHPPMIVRAKEQISKLTSRLWGQQKRPHSEKLHCDLARSRVRPKTRRQRPASSPPSLTETLVCNGQDACAA